MKREQLCWGESNERLQEKKIVYYINVKFWYTNRCVVNSVNSHTPYNAIIFHFEKNYWIFHTSYLYVLLKVRNLNSDFVLWKTKRLIFLQKTMIRTTVGKHIQIRIFVNLWSKSMWIVTIWTSIDATYSQALSWKGNYDAFSMNPQIGFNFCILFKRCIFHITFVFIMKLLVFLLQNKNTMIIFWLPSLPWRQLELPTEP